MHKTVNNYANTGVSCRLRYENAILLAKQNVPTGVKPMGTLFFVEVC